MLEDYFFPYGFDFVDYHILTYIELRPFMQIAFAVAHPNVSDEEIMPDYIFDCLQNVTFHFYCKFTLVLCLIVHAAILLNETPLLTLSLTSPIPDNQSAKLGRWVHCDVTAMPCS